MKDQLLRHGSLKRVIRIKRAQECQGSGTEPVVVLAVHDDLVADDQTDSAVRAEVAFGLVGKQPMLRQDGEGKERHGFRKRPNDRVKRRA